VKQAEIQLNSTQLMLAAVAVTISARLGSFGFF